MAFRWGFREIFGQASEVRAGRLKLGFAMQTLEGIRNSCSCSSPSFPYEYGRAEHQTIVETSSFPQPGRFQSASPRTLISSIVQQQD